MSLVNTKRWDGPGLGGGPMDLGVKGDIDRRWERSRVETPPTSSIAPFLFMSEPAFFAHPSALHVLGTLERGGAIRVSTCHGSSPSDIEAVREALASVRRHSA